MSNNNSFGGKLRKILASMCSFVVGASGVSQAAKPGTRMPTGLKFSKDTCVFGFGDFGWKLASGDAKKENSWLVRENEKGVYYSRYQLFGEANELSFEVGFGFDDFSCDFAIWVNHDVGVWVSIPKGILFDVMRHFELKYFPNAGNPRDKGTELSCAAKSVNNDAEDEVFLRFILWAFCGSDNAIKSESDYVASVEELREDIFKFAINTDDPDNAGDEFEVKIAKVKVEEEKEGEEKKEKKEKEVEKEYAVLKPCYFLENFNERVREIYKGLGCDVADMDSMVNLITKQHIREYVLGALGGGILIEGAHRFLGAKRSGSSEVNKGKLSINKVNKGRSSINKVNKGKSSINKVSKGKLSINKVSKGKLSINKVNKGKPSSNKKGEQRAKRNLKKQKS